MLTRRDVLKQAGMVAALATTAPWWLVRRAHAARREKLIALGASEDIVRGLVRLFELDGIFGLAALAARKNVEEDLQRLIPGATLVGTSGFGDAIIRRMK